MLSHLRIMDTNTWGVNLHVPDSLRNYNLRNQNLDLAILHSSLRGQGKIQKSRLFHIGSCRRVVHRLRPDVNFSV